MDPDKARAALTSRRDELIAELSAGTVAQSQDQTAAEDANNVTDRAPGLDTEAVDDAVAAGLQERLDAVDRALGRLDDGSYGKSVRSGAVIPDARLEADPAAELTVEEAAADERA